MSQSYTLKSNKSERIRLSRQAKALYGGATIFDAFIKNGNKVLDVGCGTGVIAEHIALNNGKCEVSGIDVDAKRIEQNVLKYKYKNIKFVAGDCCEIPYPDNCFDVVYCRFLLMHLANPQRAVKEMRRVVKKGGFVLSQEGVHAGIWVNPTRPYFNKFIKAWTHKMSKLGQDCSIGLRLNAIFHAAGLHDINIGVQTHGVVGSRKEFRAYMENWKRHLPSLIPSLKQTLTPRIVSEIERELSNYTPSDYYLELTALGSGRK